MINRKKKWLALWLVFPILLAVLLINFKLRLINQNCLIATLLPVFFLMWFVNPSYSDFDYDVKGLKVNETIFLSLVWQLVYEKYSLQGPIFALLKYDKKVGSYLLPFTPFPYRMGFISGLDEADLLIISPKGIYKGKYYEQIPYGGVGIATYFITQKEVVFEIIKRKK